MIEISFGKLVLLALIALIVLGPEKLPGAARTAGALLRRLRTSWDSVRAEVERELEVEELKRTAREAAAKAEAAQAQLDAGVRRVQGTAGDLTAKVSAPVPDPTAPPAAAPAAPAVPAPPAPPEEPPHGPA
ncbi:Sec-independent protein translocase protein TatB [Frateuria defendens]|uniref:Sec-independent protein translocase protein TatB n=1 Tax=Frateuria defendens TaxID=2219559 RepID=UPI00066FD342|nr:Sec-independent protein translocase protein TatB [Frateuria defendens]